MEKTINEVSPTEEQKEKDVSIISPVINKAEADIIDTLQDVNKEAEAVYKKLEILDGAEKPTMEAFINAYVGYKQLTPKNKNYLTIVDFYPNNSLGSLFYIINMKTNTVEYTNSVGHWVGSREEKASPSWSPDSYSNEKGSKQSSLWFFRTTEHVVPWWKHIREWLKLIWAEKGVNDNAYARDIYIHPAGLNQSEWCFTLPYNKAEWQLWEDKILQQLMKIKWDSILFAYDSRVFDKYKEQSKIFSWDKESVDGFGLYFTEGKNKEEIIKRIKENQEKSQLDAELFGYYDRGAEKLNTLMPEWIRLPNAIKKNRECWWKKKEIEMLAAQMWKEINEKGSFDDLCDDIDNVWIWFKEKFYRESPKVRREEIDEWVSKFREDIEDLISERGGVADLKEICANKKAEYLAWEKKSSKGQRKIDEDEYAEKRMAA